VAFAEVPEAELTAPCRLLFRVPFLLLGCLTLSGLLTLARIIRIIVVEIVVVILLLGLLFSLLLFRLFLALGRFALKLTFLKFNRLFLTLYLADWLK
jgi:hypothetical protein